MRRPKKEKRDKKMRKIKIKTKTKKQKVQKIYAYYLIKTNERTMNLNYVIS